MILTSRLRAGCGSSSSPQSGACGHAGGRLTRCGELHAPRPGTSSRTPTRRGRAIRSGCDQCRIAQRIVTVVRVNRPPSGKKRCLGVLSTEGDPIGVAPPNSSRGGYQQGSDRSSYELIENAGYFGEPSQFRMVERRARRGRGMPDGRNSADVLRPRFLWLTPPSTDQDQQPLLHHEVGDVADGARLGARPGNHVAIENPAHLRRSGPVRSGPARWRSSWVAATHMSPLTRLSVGAGAPELRRRSRSRVRPQRSSDL